jgi:hypothetical protein
VPRRGGLGCHDARQIKLGQLHFRINERFLYEYDFGDLWQHQVRIEKRLEIETSRSYPVCVGGQWAGPPEDCGGPRAFLDRRAAAPWRVRELLDNLLEDIETEDTDRRERFGRNPHGSSSAVIGTEACYFLEPMGTPRTRCCLLTGLLVRYQNRCAKSERYCISHSKRKSNWT